MNSGSPQHKPCRGIEFHFKGTVRDSNLEAHLRALETWKNCWFELHGGEDMVFNFSEVAIESAESARELSHFLASLAREKHSVLLLEAPEAIIRHLRAMTTPVERGVLRIPAAD